MNGVRRSWNRSSGRLYLVSGVFLSLSFYFQVVTLTVGFIKWWNQMILNQ